MQAQKQSLFPTESPGERKYASSFLFDVTVTDALLSWRCIER